MKTRLVGLRILAVSPIKETPATMSLLASVRAPNLAISVNPRQCISLFSKLLNLRIYVVVSDNGYQIPSISVTASYSPGPSRPYLCIEVRDQDKREHVHESICNRQTG